MKHWKSFVVSLLLCLSMAACQSGPTAEEAAEALCKLYVHADTTVSAVLDGWDTESVKSTIESKLSEQLKNNLEAIGVTEVDEAALDAVTEAMMEARKRIPLEVEVIETEEDRAALQITVGSLDVSGIDTAAAEKAMEQLKGLSEVSEADLERFVEAYTEALQSGLEEVDPSEVMDSFVVNFVKEKSLWLPEDLNGFIEELGQHIRR